MSSQSLTPEQTKIVKATAPILAEHGNTIAEVMYATMLRAHPELSEIFNLVHQHSGRQPKAISHAFHAYAANLDDLGTLAPSIELICQKHASLYLQPAHYNYVGTYWLKAMRTVLGPVVTDEMHDAWSAAYAQLVGILTAREKELYAASSGWTDWRDFKIVRKIPECEEVMSIYLEPVETFVGGTKELPPYLPGQYITIRTFIPGLDRLQPRQYSLSDVPNGKCYRISVMREEGGWVSNVLHDRKHVGDLLQVAHPYGDFFFDPKAGPADTPVIFIAAGVGATCLLSILNAIAAAAGQSGRPIRWIHSSRCAAARPFARQVLSLRTQLPLLRAQFHSSRPEDFEVQGTHYDVKGRIDISKVDASVGLFLNDSRAQYFICGPDGFMSDMGKTLLKLGIGRDRLHLQQYSTGGVGV